jgi:hypothetical protein
LKPCTVSLHANVIGATANVIGDSGLFGRKVTSAVPVAKLDGGKQSKTGVVGVWLVFSPGCGYGFDSLLVTYTIVF